MLPLSGLADGGVSTRIATTFIKQRVSTAASVCVRLGTSEPGSHCGGQSAILAPGVDHQADSPTACLAALPPPAQQHATWPCCWLGLKVTHPPPHAREHAASHPNQLCPRRVWAEPVCVHVRPSTGAGTLAFLDAASPHGDAGLGAACTGDGSHPHRDYSHLAAGMGTAASPTPPRTQILRHALVRRLVVTRSHRGVGRVGGRVQRHPARTVRHCRGGPTRETSSGGHARAPEKVYGLVGVLDGLPPVNPISRSVTSSTKALQGEPMPKLWAG